MWLVPSIRYHTQPGQLVVTLIIPVLNEEGQLASSVRRVLAALSAVPLAQGSFEVVIADNGSTDSTSEIAMSLVNSLVGIKYLGVEEKGRGRALRIAWSASRASVLAYTDVDLSTDLGHLPELLVSAMSNDFDLASGSYPSCQPHLTEGSEVVAGCGGAT